MTLYSADQLKQLWIDNGGDPNNARIAAAVALAESGGSSSAALKNKNGSTDRGLWQINSSHGAQSTFDPDQNCKAAIAISQNGTNWRPWCTAYTDAACGTKGGFYSPFSASPVGTRYQAMSSTAPIVIKDNPVTSPAWFATVPDYAKDKDNPPALDTGIAIAWTVAKVEWTYEGVLRIEAKLDSVIAHLNIPA